MSASMANNEISSASLPPPSVTTPNISDIEDTPVAEKESFGSPFEWDDDQINPRNWTSATKWQNLTIIAVMTFTTPLASSMFAPGAPQALLEFHNDSTDLETLVVSIFVLGFAIGPLVIAPLCEIYGRRPVYLISNFFFIILTVACALSNSLGMLLAFRFLAGCAGSTPITIGGASIGDMFTPDKRGSAMALWAMGPLLGPILGPVIGGFLVQAKGWRWVFWLQAIISGATLILGTLLLRETYEAKILEGHKRRLAAETGNRGPVSDLSGGLPRSELFKQALLRPMQMLLFSPIVLILSIYVAFLFGYMYLFITTFPIVFDDQYHFDTSVSGLSYLGLGVGFILGMGIAGKGSDVIYRKLRAKNDGKEKPEYRLPILSVSAPLVAISFFWYGWSAEAGTHWIVPIIGTAVFGMGVMPGFMSINMYLVHAYPQHSASALAASKVLQSLGGAFLPLAGQPLYDRLGLGWGNSVLGFLALLFAPLPWVFYTYGERIRARGVRKM